MSTESQWPHGNLPFYGPTLSRVLEDFFRRGGAQADSGDEEVAQSSWTPPVDIKESDAALTLFIELPGIDKDEIGISLESGVLTVSGERRFAKSEQESYRRVERIYGRFNRSFRVPRDVDGTKVNASYKNGVLRLELPKVEAAKPRQIKIS